MDGKPGKKYGLIIPKKKLALQKPLVKKSVFGDDSSDEETSRTSVNVSLMAEAEKKKQMKQTQIEMKKALQEDPTVYEYDSLYDKMQESKVTKEKKVKQKEHREPKYIQNLLKFAEARKKDYERHIERQVQKERENEGDEFADKESFVTSAYRQKLQEQEEEERRLKEQDAVDAANDVTKQSDLSMFYRSLLKQNVSMGGSFQVKEDAKVSDRTESVDRGKDSSRSGTHKFVEETSQSSEEAKKMDTTKAGGNDRKYGEPNSSSYKEKHAINREPCYSDEEKLSSRESDPNRRKPKQQSNSDRDCKSHKRKSPERKHRRKSASHSDSSSETETKHEKDSQRVPDNTGQTQDRQPLKEDDKQSGEGSKDDKKLSKFTKRSSKETVQSARERYLARKIARDSVKANAPHGNESDED